jgi:hypothetical protein
MRDARGAVATSLFALLLLGCGLQSAFDLEVGQCFDSPTEETEISSVSSKPCDEPHDQEVFAVFDYPDAPDEFPGDDAISDVAEARCSNEFLAFVGTDVDSSELEYYYLVPSQGTWEEDDDREIVCTVIAEEAEKLTGSMRGVNR